MAKVTNDFGKTPGRPHKDLRKTLGRPYEDFRKTLTVGWGGGLWGSWWRTREGCARDALDGEEISGDGGFREWRKGLWDFWETESDVIVFSRKTEF